MVSYPESPIDPTGPGNQLRNHLRPASHLLRSDMCDILFVYFLDKQFFLLTFFGCSFIFMLQLLAESKSLLRSVPGSRLPDNTH